MATMMMICIVILKVSESKFNNVNENDTVILAMHHQHSSQCSPLKALILVLRLILLLLYLIAWEKFKALTSYLLLKPLISCFKDIPGARHLLRGMVTCIGVVSSLARLGLQQLNLIRSL